MKLPEKVISANTANEMRRRIEKSFIGRLDEISIFHEKTNYFANHMHEDGLVTNYYGIVGIGKTLLLKRLEYEAKNRGSKNVLFELMIA